MLSNGVKTLKVNHYSINCIVHDSCGPCYACMCEQFLNLHFDLGFICVCVLCLAFCRFVLGLDISIHVLRMFVAFHSVSSEIGWEENVKYVEWVKKLHLS